MEVRLPSGVWVECEVEYDGYKPLDITDEEGRSLLYDYGLPESEVDRIYTQACQEWADRRFSNA